MFHGDRARSGWNASEVALTPSAVGSSRFGAVWSSPQLDAIDLGGGPSPPHLYASPLYVDRLTLTDGSFAGKTLSAVIAATNNGWAYAVCAFDEAGVQAGRILWRAQLGHAALVPKLDGGLPLGVLSTPVLDLLASPPRLYVVSDDGGTWRAFAIDLGAGRILPDWPVDLSDATVGAIDQNGPARFADATVLSQRSALALSPGGDRLYVSFGAYADGASGWMVAIDTALAQVAASFSSAPSSAPTAFGGMWSAGGAAVGDDGRVFMTTGNAPDGSGPMPHVWGETLLAFAPSLALSGSYTPFNYCALDTSDADLGGSSPLLLPELAGTSTPHLIAFGGKQGNVYLVDRDRLPGRLDQRPSCSSDSTSDGSLVPPGPQPQFGQRGPLNVFGPYSDQFGNNDLAKMRTTPALLRDSDGTAWLFVSGATKAAVDSSTPVPPSLARLKVVTPAGAPAYLAIDATERTLAFINPGSTVVSSSGADGAVVWVLDENAQRVTSLADPAAPHPILYAVDARTMTPLWRSAPRELAVGGKYSTPLVARGLVIVGTDRLQAFGLR
jgi:hypothetical protein